MNQLSSDVQSGIRILHEYEFAATRYRAYTVADPECQGAVYIDRYDRDLKEWEDTRSPLVLEEAALVLELAKLAGRVK